jgi:hypothetical protein
MTGDVRRGLLSTARINQALIAGIRAAEGAELVAVATGRTDPEATPVGSLRPNRRA